MQMRAGREQSHTYRRPVPREVSDSWSLQDGYMAALPDEERTYVLCDHCRSTLVVRPYLHRGELYMECQVCEFTYKNTLVGREPCRSRPD